MLKKVLLNVFYNLSLIFLVICLFWSIKHQYYLLSLGELFLIGMIVFFKLRLIREVKAATGKKK